MTLIYFLLFFKNRITAFLFSAWTNGNRVRKRSERKNLLHIWVPGSAGVEEWRREKKNLNCILGFVWDAFGFWFLIHWNFSWLLLKCKCNPDAERRGESRKRTHNNVNKFAFIKRRRRLKDCDSPEARSCYKAHTRKKNEYSEIFSRWKMFAVLAEIKLKWIRKVRSRLKKFYCEKFSICLSARSFSEFYRICSVSMSRNCGNSGGLQQMHVHFLLSF